MPRVVYSYSDNWSPASQQLALVSSVWRSIAWPKSASKLRVVFAPRQNIWCGDRRLLLLLGICIALCLIVQRLEERAQFLCEFGSLLRWRCDPTPSVKRLAPSMRHGLARYSISQQDITSYESDLIPCLLQSQISYVYPFHNV
jgi:hypothetical protein